MNMEKSIQKLEQRLNIEAVRIMLNYDLSDSDKYDNSYSYEA